jgi:hypothetical protein
MRCGTGSTADCGKDGERAVSRLAIPCLLVSSLLQGDALEDPSFTDRGDDVLYHVNSGAGRAPYTVTVELLYQPIGYRWAHNLEPYAAAEPRRFVSYFQSMQNESATVLARTRSTPGISESR